MFSVDNQLRPMYSLLQLIVNICSRQFQTFIVRKGHQTGDGSTDGWRKTLNKEYTSLIWFEAKKVNLFVIAWLLMRSWHFIWNLQIIANVVMTCTSGDVNRRCIRNRQTDRQTFHYSDDSMFIFNFKIKTKKYEWTCSW